MEISSIQTQAERIKDEVAQLKSATSHSIADSSERIYRLQVISSRRPDRMFSDVPSESSDKIAFHLFLLGSERQCPA